MGVTGRPSWSAQHRQAPCAASTSLVASVHQDGWRGSTAIRGDDPPEPPAVLAWGDDPPEPPAVLAWGDDPPEPAVANSARQAASRGGSAVSVGGSCSSTGPSLEPRPDAARISRATGSVGSRSRFTWVRYRLAF